MSSRQLSYDTLGEPTFRIVEPGAAPDQGAVLAASGELDRDTAGLLLASLDRLWRSGRHGTIALDLGALTFIDAAGARCLLSCRQIAEGHGLHLTVRNLQPGVRRVLDVLGIPELLATGD
jgi:anti-anti-sigma factor